MLKEIEPIHFPEINTTIVQAIYSAIHQVSEAKAAEEQGLLVLTEMYRIPEIEHL